MRKDKKMNINRIKFMIRISSFIIALMLIIPLAGFAKSLYYYEPFTNEAACLANGWTWNFNMGRDIYIEENYVIFYKNNDE